MKRHRTDANQPQIVDAYRARGCSVLVLSVSQSLDLLVGTRGVTDAVEVKDGSKPASRRKLTPAEDALHCGWRGSPVVVVMTDADVGRHVSDMHRRAGWVADGRVVCDVPRRNLQ